uniref:Putative secreted protein n=1 Tax=Ixodes ricinus TaxID=34613 RepID=A0A6B0U7J5_IXORI
MKTSLIKLWLSLTVGFGVVYPAVSFLHNVNRGNAEAQDIHKVIGGKGKTYHILRGTYDPLESPLIKYRGYKFQCGRITTIEALSERNITADLSFDAPFRDRL